MKTETAPAPATKAAAVTTRPEPAMPATEAKPRLKLLSGVYDLETTNKAIADAKAMVGRIPLLPGEETSKTGAKGITVSRLDAYNWSAVNPDVIPTAKRAVRILLWAQQGDRLFKA